MDKPEFQDAARVQQSLLAAAEKKTLIWFAQRMPAWVNSDHLTALGLLGMLGAGLCYWWARVYRPALFLVVVCLAINWFGDSLDGTLARVRNRLRPRYGFYIDHIVDAFGALFLLSGLALSGYMSVFIAMGVLIVYFLLSIEIYLATYTIGMFKLSYWKAGPTELRILLCIGSVFIYYKPMVKFLGEQRLLFDVGGVCVMIGLILIVLASVFRNTRTLYRQERLP